MSSDKAGGAGPVEDHKAWSFPFGWTFQDFLREFVGDINSGTASSWSEYAPYQQLQDGDYRAVYAVCLDFATAQYQAGRWAQEQFNKARIEAAEWLSWAQNDSGSPAAASDQLPSWCWLAIQEYYNERLKESQGR